MIASAIGGGDGRRKSGAKYGDVQPFDHSIIKLEITPMALGPILIVLLIIFLLGGFSGRFGGYGYGFGHGGVGLLGTVLIVVVVLMVLERI